MSISNIFLPPLITTPRPLDVKRPMFEASTPRRSISSKKALRELSGTARVMRSCDSLIHICQGAIPGYLSKTLSSFTSKPPDSLAISATEHERPPAPLSVMEW